MSDVGDEVNRLQRDLRYKGEGEGASDAELLERPEHREYFMGIALAVRERANCLGRRVGAVLVVKDPGGTRAGG